MAGQGVNPGGWVGVPWSLDPHQRCSESRCKVFMGHRKDALRYVACNKS